MKGAAQLRREFHDQLKKTARNSGLLAARLGILLFPPWIVFDHLLEPDHATEFATVRIAASGVMLVLYGVLQWHPLGRRYPEPLVFLLVATMEIALAWMIPRVEAAPEAYLLGLSLAITASGALVVWRVRWTIATAAVAFLALAFFYALEPTRLTAHSAGITTFYLLCAAVIAVFSSLYHYQTRWREFSVRTALRRARREAERARKSAEAANRAKSEFLSRMSHELRTPMNSVLGFAQLLARKELPPDQRKGVDHILKAGKHLLTLIDEVLDLARIEANRQQLSLEPVYIRTLLDEVLNLIRPLATQRDCHLENGTESLPDYRIHADRQRLTQVLLNLLSNAIKYNRPGGSVHVACERDGGRLRIAVQDTGIGIAPEKMEQLFVPFARLGAEQTEVEGTGLGLALSKGLVELMGGHLHVQSTPGQGSTFSVELPLAEDPATLGEESRISAAFAPAVDAASATVLYIEENLANLSLVETILADRSHIRLLSALQGQIGLDLAWEHAPELILLDLYLPDLPGEEVLRRLQLDPRSRAIPVIVISADASDTQMQRLREAGAHSYLTKPLDIDRFLGTVDAALAEQVAASGRAV